MTDALSITVVGAVAIGSAVAFSLARAGSAPMLVARGEALAAIRRDGLRVDKWDDGGTVRLEVTDTPAELGPQGLVIGTMKAQDWTASIATPTPLIARQTALLPPINGIPWWYFDGQGGPLEGERVTAVDPDGALLTALPARSVIGSVVYMGVTRVAPGVVRWTSGNKFVLGEPTGRPRERTERVAAILRQSGFDVSITDDIRAGIWTKLIGNAAFNPLSAIARADRRDHERLRFRPHRASPDARSRSGRGSGRCPVGDGYREALCDQSGAWRSSHLDAAGLRGRPRSRTGRARRCSRRRSAYASASRHR
jgi:2-dehydropantoate 2-reductase